MKASFPFATRVTVSFPSRISTSHVYAVVDRWDANLGQLISTRFRSIESLSWMSSQTPEVLTDSHDALARFVISSLTGRVRKASRFQPGGQRIGDGYFIFAPGGARRSAVRLVNEALRVAEFPDDKVLMTGVELAQLIRPRDVVEFEVPQVSDLAPARFGLSGRSSLRIGCLSRIETEALWKAIRSVNPDSIGQTMTATRTELDMWVQLSLMSHAQQMSVSP